MSSKWIVNASPQIILGKLNLIALLDQLCDEWIIPSGVAEEIKEGQENDPAKKWLQNEGIEKIQEVCIHPKIASWDLGKGESEVLSFAYEHPEYIAILDDAAARNCAKSLNIKIHGTLWILIETKRKQKISALTPVLVELQQINFRISPDLLAMAKHLAGEED